MTDQDITLSVCSDCIMLIANGETPPEMDEDETQAWLEAMDPISNDENYHLAYGCDEGCEGPFSWSSCELCKRPEGGSRHKVIALRR